MPTAYIAIGSNLGGRQEAIRTALARLADTPGIHVTAVASVRETEPVDAPPGSGRFLNGAIAVQTTLAPHELLALLLQIERELGRDRAFEPEIRNAPRVLDLDLLLYGDQVLDSPELTLPHPRMHERRFVLEPLSEIAPQAMHPVMKKNVFELLQALPAS